MHLERFPPAQKNMPAMSCRRLVLLQVRLNNYVTLNTEFDVSSLRCMEIDIAGSSNITSVHSANISGCIDECAIYNGTESWLAVFYDDSFNDGFENCYLLNDTGTEIAPLNSTYAERV